MNDRELFSVAFVLDDAVKQISRVNEAIAEIVFGQARSGFLCHLDLDDEKTALIEQILELSTGSFDLCLRETVTGVRKDRSVEKAFMEFGAATDKWRRRNDRLSTPPAMCCLALLCRAAEQMSNDGEFAQNNYYVRLSEILGLDDNNTKIQEEYRKHAINIWSSLVEWLEAWEGERGIATVPLPQEGQAKSQIRFWAVRMPISQALLRKADRDDLTRMFKLYRLDPLMPISQGTMETILDDWCRSYANEHLKSIWKKPDLRELVVSSAITLLASWEGSEVEERTGAINSSLRVLLSLVLSRLTRRAEFGVVVRSNGSEPFDEVEVESRSGSSFRFAVAPSGPMLLRLVDCGQIDSASLVEDVIKISTPGKRSAGKRTPRSIVPMILDPQTREYLEVESVTLGFPHGLLVRRQIGMDGQAPRDFLGEVVKVLEANASPGWILREQNEFHGIPEDWTFIENVTFLCHPGPDGLPRGLEVMSPIGQSALFCRGGFRLPGRREVWLNTLPPRIVAIDPSSTPVTIEFLDVTTSSVISSEDGVGAVTLVLDPASLRPGTYFARAIFANGEIRQHRLTLVDADTRNIAATLKPWILTHSISPSSGRSLISAECIDADSVLDYVQGLRVTTTAAKVHRDLKANAVPSEPPWLAAQPVTADLSHDKIKLVEVDRGSCSVRGAHHFVFPPYLGGRKNGHIEGVCKYCFASTGGSRRGGATRRTNTPLSAHQKHEASLPALMPLEQVEPGSWDHVLEAVSYLRQGTASDLAALCSQASAGEFGLDRMVRTFSGLGHIDVELDDRSRPVSWSVSPPVIAIPQPGRAFLAGFRSRNLAEAVESMNGLQGMTVHRFANSAGPATIEIRFGSEENLETLRSNLSKVCRGIGIVHQPGPAMLRALPALSALVLDGPRARIPPHRVVRSWSVERARWESADSALRVGAHQFQGFGYFYSFNQSAIQIDEATLILTASAVKHLDAAREKRLLMFYDRGTQVLGLRLGAELPGLLHRAVIACSGRAPEEDEERHLMNYHDVPLEVAEHVAWLLSN